MTHRPQEDEYNARNDTQAQSEEAGHQGRQGRAERQQVLAERQQVLQVEAERQQVRRLDTSSTTKDITVKSVMSQACTVRHLQVIGRASSLSHRPLSRRSHGPLSRRSHRPIRKELASRRRIGKWATRVTHISHTCPYAPTAWSFVAH